jgi:hypothetical protein
MKRRMSTHGHATLLEALEERRLLATFVVNTLSDSIEQSNELSLRGAITLANETPGADQIIFAQGLTGTILLQSELPRIMSEVSIQGPGAGVLAIGNAGNTGDLARILEIEDGNDSAFVITISGLRIFGGTIGIDNSKVLIVEDVVIEQNGQGIINQVTGSLTLITSTVRSNGVLNTGGSGVVNFGSAAIRESSITGNQSFVGGGVSNAGTLVIDNSLIAHNRVYDYTGYRPGSQEFLGGGIYNEGTLTVRSTTISDNFAQTRGGGVVNTGVLNIYNSTVAFNSVAETTLGGGIYHAGDPSLLVSTIVSNNFAVLYNTYPDRAPSDLGGDGIFASESTNNLIGDAASASGFVDGMNGNIVGANPLLRPLANNGGPTLTHQLTALSPAINAGVNPLDLDTDQRGQQRLRGDAVDIGAVETNFVSGYSLQTVADGIVSTTADAENQHRVLIRTTDGSLVVFEEGWEAVNLQALTGAPNALGDGAIYTDPKNGLVYVMAIGEGSRAMLFIRDGFGDWAYRDLSAEAGTGLPFAPGTLDVLRVREVTRFTALGGRVFVAFLIDTATGLGTPQASWQSNRLILLEQTGLTDDAGRLTWRYTDLQEAVGVFGQTLPQMRSLTSYVTTWNAWHMAGLDSNGQIISVWTATTFDGWRVDNLSTITGAQPIEGGLSAVLTSWSGINLTGVDNAGRLIVTWWVPSFGADWVSSDLTELTDGPTIQATTLTGYGTSWDGMNYLGLDAQGRVIVFWWAPASNVWNVVPLYSAASNANNAPVPTGRMTSYASAEGTLNVLGSNDAGDTIRISLDTQTQALWLIQNLSAISLKR